MSKRGISQQAEMLEKSKYELTLAEFPTFPVAKSKMKGLKPRIFADTITGKDGEPIKRIWTVIPHRSLGFGTPSTHATLFELMQIWKEQGFARQHIQFGSIFHLLKRMGKGTGNSQYQQILKDLDTLVGITIKAVNAFWDNEHRAYVDCTFHLFDSVSLYKETSDGKATLALAFIKASDYLFNNSILKNSLLSLPFDSKLFHRLSPVEQRLALYLSKVFRSQTLNKRELLEFAGQIPLEVKEPKLIKQRIKIACNGLMRKGFSLLGGYSFEKGTDRKSDFVLFKRKGLPPNPKFPAGGQGQKKLPAPVNASEDLEYLTKTILEFCGDQKSFNFYKKVARLVPRNIIFRALSEAKVSNDLSETIKSKAAHFTYLVRKYGKDQGIKI